MSASAARRLAWGLAAVAVLLVACALAIQLAADTTIDVENGSFVWAIIIAFTVTGHLIATRQSSNPIGWLFLGVGVSAALGALAGAYARSWVDSGVGYDPLARTAAWYGGLSWMPFVLVPATFLLLLFPDGHLLSQRWRPVAWCAGIGIAGGFLATGLTPGPLEDYPSVTNPYGVDSGLINALEGLSFLALAAAVTGSSISIVLHFRRARGDERQQMKWIALAGVVAAVTIPVMIIVYDVVGAAVANGTIMVSIIGLPVATAVAIRKYRLYDIDVVINRALVYGSLTALLAGTYLGSVLLLQLVLASVTRGSGLAVAASTLATAALVRPARARIQTTVDRRFFRRKYDASRTLSDFGAQLRDQVDLEALQLDLRRVVTETMQPANVAVWVRPQGGVG